MVAKYWCDLCETEMRPNEHQRLRCAIGNVEIEVMHAINRVWNGGHLCHTCTRRVVNEGTPTHETLSKSAAETMIAHPVPKPSESIS